MRAWIEQVAVSRRHGFTVQGTAGLVMSSDKERGDVSRADEIRSDADE